VLSPPLDELPMLEDSAKEIGLVTSHATNKLCIICVIHDFRDVVASVLWNDGAETPAKRVLLRATANLYQKKMNVTVSNDET